MQRPAYGAFDPAVVTRDSDADIRARRGELRLRVLSAIVLIAVSVTATVVSPWSFAVLVAAICLALSWEWARLIGDWSPERAASRTVLHFTRAVSVLTGAGMSAAGNGWGFVVVGGVVGLITIAASSPHQRTWHLFGTLYIVGPALALAALRFAPDAGLTAILFVFFVVWGADSGAFLFGRVLGGPRAFPSISPNKTWAGNVGGVLAGLWVGVVAAQVLGLPLLCNLAIVGVVLAVLTLAGDYGESALKRHFGAKDVSALIPGHGGFLDRVDGLVIAAVGALAIGAACDLENPARGLLQLTGA